MDPFELLKTDHRKVAQLFDEIESAKGQSKKQLFGQLKAELDVHAHIEEKIFYPALENKEESRDITLEAFEEHKVVKDLLAELAGDGAANDEWDAKLKVLRENVEHHVEEEEGELFDKAEDVLSSDQLDTIGAEMEAEKATQLGTKPPVRKAQSTKRQPAKAAKKQESGGVLQRLANLIGIGDASDKKAGAKKKTAAKSSGSKSGSKKSAGKAAGAKKGAAKKAAKGGKRATKQAAKKSAGKKSSIKTSSKSGKAKSASRSGGGTRARKSTKRGR